MEKQLQSARQPVLMDDLVEDVCWNLVASSDVARIGFVLDDVPWILPVNVQLMGRSIVFRTAWGSMLHSLARKSPVVVEVDHMDSERRTGWSVLVRGELEEIAPDVRAIVDGAVHPWGPDEKDRWMWVVGTSISGRSITRQDPLRQFRLPYMPPD